MKFHSIRCPCLHDLPSPPLEKVGWPWTEETPYSANSLPDGSTWPKISVVTPSCNQGQFLEETIRSILLQGYPNVEYLVIDGGSTDASVSIIRKYESWLAYWVSEPDRGQSHAINKGIQMSTGKILLWLNSDDVCLPGAFERVALAFHANPSVELVIGQARVINEQSQVTGGLCSQFTDWEELVTNPGNSVRQISTFFARRLFDELGFVNETLQIAMDTELLVRFTRHHLPLVLDDYLTAYRVHAAAKTSQQLIAGYEESDKTRPKYLDNRSLQSRYRARSSSNWLSLAEAEHWSLKRRWLCVARAIQNRPQAFFSRSFWSVVKKLIVAHG